MTDDIRHAQSASMARTLRAQHNMSRKRYRMQEGCLPQDFSAPLHDCCMA